MSLQFNISKLTKLSRMSYQVLETSKTPRLLTLLLRKRLKPYGLRLGRKGADFRRAAYLAYANKKTVNLNEVLRRL